MLVATSGDKLRLMRTPHCHDKKLIKHDGVLELEALRCKVWRPVLGECLDTFGSINLAPIVFAKKNTTQDPKQIETEVLSTTPRSGGGGIVDGTISWVGRKVVDPNRATSSSCPTCSKAMNLPALSTSY